LSAQISILAANVAQLLTTGYTRIEVWQSTDCGNTFQEITSGGAASASVSSLPALTTFLMGGSTLVVAVDGGAPQTIAFGSVLTYWTPAQVATCINNVVTGLASVVGTQVVLTSPTTGRTSQVQVVSCSAPQLFSAPVNAYGTLSRPTLTTGVFSYIVVDVAGDPSYRYKWRFSANGSSPISSYAPTVYGTNVSALNSSLSYYYGSLCDVSGQPLRSKIVVTVINLPQNIGGFLISGNCPLIFEPDEFGFVQMALVQGAIVKIAIDGTDFVRQVTVPSTATFDLLTIMNSAPDTYTVQTTPPLLERRSL
jgi:hypothetical protein